MSDKKINESLKRLVDAMRWECFVFIDNLEDEDTLNRLDICVRVLTSLESEIGKLRKILGRGENEEKEEAS